MSRESEIWYVIQFTVNRMIPETWYFVYVIKCVSNTNVNLKKIRFVKNKIIVILILKEDGT